MDLTLLSSLPVLRERLLLVSTGVGLDLRNGFSFDVILYLFCYCDGWAGWLIINMIGIVVLWG